MLDWTRISPDTRKPVILGTAKLNTSNVFSSIEHEVDGSERAYALSCSASNKKMKVLYERRPIETGTWSPILSKARALNNICGISAAYKHLPAKYLHDSPGEISFFRTPESFAAGHVRCLCPSEHPHVPACAKLWCAREGLLGVPS
jgi:hypothetical protein